MILFSNTGRYNRQTSNPRFRSTISFDERPLCILNCDLQLRHRTRLWRLVHLFKYHTTINIKDTPLLLAVISIQIVRGIRSAGETAARTARIDVADHCRRRCNDCDVVTAARRNRDVSIAQGGCGRRFCDRRCGIIGHSDGGRDAVGRNLCYAVRNIGADRCGNAVDCRGYVGDACARPCTWSCAYGAISVRIT